jgi:hypothetical protein
MGRVCPILSLRRAVVGFLDDVNLSLRLDSDEEAKRLD